MAVAEQRTRAATARTLKRRTGSATVGVVIPLFNGAPWIEGTLASVFRQSLPPDRVVVVDDGSTDNSAEIVASISNVTLIANQVKGPSSARNAGLKMLSTDYVAFLDQDDRWHPDHLRVLVEVLEAHPDCPGVAAKTCYRLRDERSKLNDLEAGTASSKELDPWSYFPAQVIPTPSSVLLARDDLLEIGGWPTDITGVADLYVWLMISIARPLRMTSCVTIEKWIGPENTSNRMRRDDPIGYLRIRVEAMERVVRARQLSMPSDQKSVMRHRAYVQGFAVMESLVGGADSLVERIDDFENAVRKVPSAADFVARNLVWHMAPALQLDVGTDFAPLWSRLLAGWPRRDSLAGKAMTRHLFEKLPPRRLLKYLFGGIRPAWQYADGVGRIWGDLRKSAVSE